MIKKYGLHYKADQPLMLLGVGMDLKIKNIRWNFLSVAGTLYVILNSWKDKGKKLNQHILKDIVTRVIIVVSYLYMETHQMTLTKLGAVVGREQHAKKLSLLFYFLQGLLIKHWPPSLNHCSRLCGLPKSMRNTEENNSPIYHLRICEFNFPP